MIDTPRLRLTPLRAEDASALHGITGTPEIFESISFLPAGFSLDDAERLIASIDDANMFLGMREKPGGALVGVVGVHRADGDEIEVGYWVGVAFQGRGFASEALAHVVGFLRTAFPGSPVIAECAPANAASRHLLLKAGFVETREDGHRAGLKRFVHDR